MQVNIAEICKDGLLLKSVPKKNQTEELCRVAVEQNPLALRYVAKRLKNADLCRMAIKGNSNAIKYAPSEVLTEEICKAAIKENPSLLSVLSLEHKTRDVCRIAVNKNVDTFVDVPEKIRAELFDAETPFHVLENVANQKITWIRYLPTRSDTIELFIDCVKKNMALSQFLPEEAKRNLSIIQLQKAENKYTVISKGYDVSTGKFVVNALILCGACPEYNEQSHFSYDVAIKFDDFDNFYDFLDHDLQNADLRDYDFDGVDIRKYNIDGAVIHSAILQKYGLYDDSFAKSLREKMLKEEKQISEETELEKYTTYLKPVDEEGYDENDDQHTVVFYISDLHLSWRIYNHFNGAVTKEEAYAYVRWVARTLIESVGTMPLNSLLMIAGDTTSDFDIAKVFYKELARVWRRFPIRSHKIIVVHGNHELRSPWKDIDENLSDYRDFFNECGIILVHNAVVYYDNSSKIFKMLYEQDIINLNEKEIRNLLFDKPIIILGGIGFSGLNRKYNSSNMLYGKTFEDVPQDTALQRELDESQRFERIYKKVVASIPNNRVIVLTHMKMEDWSKEKYNKNWIYLYGHDHRNYYSFTTTRKVFADNQIGRRGNGIGLKYFYIDDSYDIFAYYDDGIHSITKNQYLDFNRGKAVLTQCSKDLENIFMIKRNGYYLFLSYEKYIKSSTRKHLYLLNGGKLQALPRNCLDDLDYYYNNLDSYVANVQILLERYTVYQKKISHLIKKIGGIGKIHGCIIDVDKPTDEKPYSVCHIFVNPADGKITPYYAETTAWRIAYKDIHTMLGAHTFLSGLKEKYQLLENNMDTTLMTLHCANDMTIWAKKKRLCDAGSYIYKISKIIRSLQYITDKNIVRNWNEVLLNADIIDRINTARTSDGLLDDRLTEGVPSLEP